MERLMLKITTINLFVKIRVRDECECTKCLSRRPEKQTKERENDLKEYSSNLWHITYDTTTWRKFCSIFSYANSEDYGLQVEW